MERLARLYVFIEIETSDIRRSDVRMTHRAVLRRPCSCEPGVRTIALKKDVTNGKRQTDIGFSSQAQDSLERRL